MAYCIPFILLVASSDSHNHMTRWRIHGVSLYVFQRRMLSIGMKSSRVTVRRAAFDVGSGSTKMQCSDCELYHHLETGAIQCDILNSLYGLEVPVQFGADYMRSSDGTLSETIQDEGIRVFSKLKEEAEKLGATEFSAIATEVFRKASNGASYINRLMAQGVSVSMLSQQQEAELGYSSVLATLKLSEHVFSEPLCVWDSGGASFQITRMNNEGFLQAYMGALGSSVSTSILVKDIQYKPLLVGSTPNPVSEDELERFISHLMTILPPVPGWLANTERLAASAGSNSMFRLCCTILAEITGKANVTSFDRNEAIMALTSCLMKTDEELFKYSSFPNSDGPHLIVPKLSLLVAVLRHVGIGRVDAVSCVGSCAGLLSDQRFWPPF